MYMFRYNLLEAVKFLWTLSCTSVADLLKHPALLCTFEQASAKCGTSAMGHHDPAPEDTHSTTWIYVYLHICMVTFL